MIGDLYALYQWDKLETAKESRDFPPPKKKGDPYDRIFIAENQRYEKIKVQLSVKEKKE